MVFLVGVSALGAGTHGMRLLPTVAGFASLFIHIHQIFSTFSKLALIATITVLKLIRTAPIAGLSIK